MADLSISSSAFGSGSEIPKKYGYKHGNASPPLTIENIPENCASLALIVDDPDAVGPAGKVWVHWLVWNIPPESPGFDESGTPSGSLEGRTDFDEVGYGGPAPPDKRHTYIFKLYALDSKIDLAAGASKKQLERAMQDHVIAQTKLEGTFAP